MNLRGIYHTAIYEHNVGKKKKMDTRDKIINEPGRTQRKQSDPISLEDEQVWDFDAFHRVFLESVRFVHVESPDENCEGRENAETE
jgi:hypothetical protein